jgi:hypothetical protein
VMVEQPVKVLGRLTDGDRMVSCPDNFVLF